VSEPDAIIERLKDTFDKDKTLVARLERSIVQARDLAEANLDSKVFSALEW